MILFRDDDLLVRERPVDGVDRCVVTFDNHSIAMDLEAPGFGEQFFVDRGIPVIVVRGRGNDWYHYAGIADALAAVRARTARYRRIMTYGSSMGGYAALRFADAVGATACLALSPQYTLDPAIVPFEDRWEQDARRIEWHRAPLRCAFVPVVCYDCRGPDRLHAALIAADTPIASIALPFGGHPISTFLADIGLLEALVVAVLDGVGNPAWFTRAALKSRRGSAIYLSQMAQRQPARRSALAIHLAEAASRLAPASPLVIHALATVLTRASQHEQALPLHRRALELGGNSADLRWAYSHALEAAGDLASARKQAWLLAREQPRRAHVHHWLGHLLWYGGDSHGAIRQTRLALALVPDDPLYAAALASYLDRMKRHRRIKRWLAALLRRVAPPWRSRDPRTARPARASGSSR